MCLALKLVAVLVACGVLCQDKPVLEGGNLALEVGDDLTGLFQVLLSDRALFLAQPKLFLQPSLDVFGFTLLNLSLILSVLALLGLFEFVAEGLNFGSLVYDGQLEISTLTLKLFNCSIALRNLLLLLTNYLNHKVLLAVIVLLLCTTR